MTEATASARRTPTRMGVRYRYYVSHPILQQRQDEAGSVGRVPAADIEKLVLEGVRNHPASGDKDEGASGIADRDLIGQRAKAVTIKPRGVEVRLLPASGRRSDDTYTAGSRPPAPRQLANDRHHAALDISWVYRRQGNPPFARCSNAYTEFREPGCPARCHRQSQAMD